MENDEICDFLEDMARGAIRCAVVLGVVGIVLVFGLGWLAGWVMA